MFCSKCGKDNSDAAKFCSGCGSVIGIKTVDNIPNENPMVNKPNEIDSKVNQNNQKDGNVLSFIKEKKIITVKPIKKSSGIIEIRFSSMEAPSLYGRVIPDEQKGTVSYCLYDDESRSNLILKIQPQDILWVQNDIFDEKGNYLGKIVEKCSGLGFNPVYQLEIVTNDNKSILAKEKGGIIHFTFKWIGQLLFGHGADILSLFFFFLTPRKGTIELFTEDKTIIATIERKGPSFGASWSFFISRDYEKISKIMDPRIVLAVQSLMSFGKGK